MKTTVGPEETDSSSPGRTAESDRSALKAHNSFKRGDRFVCFMKEPSRRGFSESQSEGHVALKHWDELQFPLAAMAVLQEHPFTCTMDLFRVMEATVAICLFVAFLSALLPPSALHLRLGLKVFVASSMSFFTNILSLNRTLFSIWNPVS